MSQTPHASRDPTQASRADASQREGQRVHPHRRAASPPGRRHDGLLFTMLWLVTAATAGSALLEARPAESLPVLRGTVNPNTAPWAELTVLPRIGETMARAIVRYREAATGGDGAGSRPVFRRAADLAQVRGIGPKTVQRLAPYLHFAAE